MSGTSGTRSGKTVFSAARRLSLGLLLVIAGLLASASSAMAAGETHATETLAKCTSLNLSNLFECNVEVIELADPDHGDFGTDPPVGSVAFSSDRAGTFSGGGKCTLVTVPKKNIEDPNKSACEAEFSANELGVHHIKATYAPEDSGEINHHSASSGETTVSFQATTSILLSCPPNAKNNTTITCTATVFHLVPFGTQGGHVPSGQLQLNHTNQGSFTRPCNLQPATATSSSCTFDYTPTSARGQHEITVGYLGDEANLPSSSTGAKFDVFGTRFAAPHGTGAEPCEDKAKPCKLSLAAGGFVELGDEVIVLPGEYSDTAGDLGQLTLPGGVLVHGDRSQPRPVINLKQPTSGFVGNGSLGFVEIKGSALHPVATRRGLVTEVVVRSDAPKAIACEAGGPNGFIQDSACLTTGKEGTAFAYISSQNSGETESSTLRQVTAISSGEESVGILFRLTTQAKAAELVTTARGVIARGTRKDVVAEALGVNGTKVQSIFLQSDYVAVATNGGNATITAPGTGERNTKVEPKLAADGYHETPDSPTIDYSVPNDPLTGPRDVDGEARIENGSIDIGADESNFPPTTTTVNCEPSTLQSNATTACQATVATNANDGVAPDGEVQFEADGEGLFRGASACDLQPISGSNGEATCGISYIPTGAAGGRQVTARYLGNEKHSGSLGSTQLTVEEANPPLTFTTTSVTCAPPSVKKGESTTCQATVKDPANGPAPVGGKVELASRGDGTFGESAEPSATCDLPANGGSEVKCNLSYTPSAAASVPNHRIYATYLGDGVHAVSQAHFELGVSDKAQTQVGIKCQPEALKAGQNTRCLARVVDKSAVSPETPTGELTFSANGAPGVFLKASSCALVARTGNEASCEVTYRPNAAGSGVHKLSASYSGDATHEQAQSDTELTVSESVPPLHATVAAFSCVNPTLPAGGETSCTLTLQDVDPAASAPLGEAALSSDGPGVFVGGRTCLLQSGPLVGQANCEVHYKPNAARPEPEPHHLTAEYQGDATHTTASSTATVAVTEAVPPLHVSKVKESCESTELIVGESVKCSVTVRDEAPERAQVPSGQVTFTKGTAPGAFTEGSSCQLVSIAERTSGCLVTYKANGVGAGVHEIVATYPGKDVNGGGDDAVQVNVTQITPPQHPTKTTLSCDKLHLQAGESASCVARVQDEATHGFTTPKGQVKLANNGAAGVFTGGETCPLTEGVATEAKCEFTYRANARGSVAHSLTGSYKGDPGHAESTSAALVIDVAEATVPLNQTKTTLRCNAAALQAGESTRCTATVKNEGSSTQGLTGQVNFTNNGAPGTFTEGSSCNIPAGAGTEASCEVAYRANARGSGSHAINATYAGDGAHASSPSTAVNIAVSEAATPLNETKTMLSCEKTSLKSGQSTKCKAKVKDEAQSATALTGTVRFTNGNAPGTFTGSPCQLPTGSTEASCEVTYQADGAGSGSHKITGTYSGDSSHFGSESAPVSIGVSSTQVTSTQTALTCQNATLTAGQSTTCTATVSNEGGGGEVPGGEVSFSNGGAPGGFTGSPCQLNNQASCEVTYTPSDRGEAPHAITANYKGDDNHAESTSSAFPITVTAVLHDIEMNLSCAPANLEAGEIADCTGTVKDIAAANRKTPTGRLQFGNGSAPGTFISGGECELGGSGDEASCNVSYRPNAAGAGAHQIQATYSGDGSHKVGTSPAAPVTVTEAATPLRATKTTIACADATLVAGESTRCTATVKDEAGPGQTPSGNVLFDNHGSNGVFTSGKTCKLEGEGTEASCEVTYRGDAQDNAQITSIYQGDDAHQSSESTPVSIQVVEASTPFHPTVTTLACNDAALQAGATTKCTATIKDQAGSATTPTGLVRFTNDGSAGIFTDGRTCLLPSGSGAQVICEVTYKPSAAGTGAHELHAIYEGDSSHAASESAAANIDVSEATPPLDDTTISLACGNTSLGAGESTACTASVKDVSGAPKSLKDGEVRFTNNAASGTFVGGGSCTLPDSTEASCQVTYRVDAGSSAPQKLNAIYQGDGAHKSVESDAEQITVAGAAAHATTTTVSCAPAPLAVGQTAKCKATVKDVDQTPSNLEGNVVFDKGSAPGTFVGTAACPLPTGSTEASCEVTYRADARGSGSHAIKATYQKNGAHERSESTPFALTVNDVQGPPHATKTALACAAPQLKTGEGVKCTVTVTDENSAATAPGGAVAFSNNGAAGAFTGSPCQLKASGPASASCDVTYQASGAAAQTLTAAYQGDPTHAASQAQAQLKVTLAAPDTKIKKKAVKHSNGRAYKLTLISTEPGSTFQCKLDKKKFTNCRSPFNLRVKRGRHVLLVRAVNSEGLADPSPFRFRWQAK